MSVLTAILLRLALLLQPEPLWYDETFSVLVARLPFDRLIAATAGDVHPPLYYLLLKAWFALWPSAPVELWARAFSLVCSVAALWLWYVALWGMDDIPEPQKRLAFLVVCFMPGLVWFSVEARMYALLSVFVLAAWVCLLGERPLWAGVFLGLGALVHSVGLLYAIAIAAIYIAYRRAWVAFWMMTAAAGMALLVYTPWAAVIIRQVAQTGGGYWIWMPTPGTVAYMLFQATAYTRTASPGLDAALMLLVAGVTSFGLWQARRVAVAWLPVVMVGLMVIASYATGTGVLLHRALIPAVYFLSLAWAWMLARADVGRVLAALSVVAVGYVVGLYFVDGRTGATYDNVLAALEPRSGDVVIASSFGAVPLTLYDDTPVVITDKALEAGMFAGMSRESAVALGLTIADPETIDWTRAWLIWTETPGLEDRPYIDDLIARYHGAHITTWHEGLQGELWLLQR